MRMPEGNQGKTTPTKRLDDDAETKFFVLRFQWFCLPYSHFFPLPSKSTRAVKTHTKAQTRREDSEPCFLNRAFARLQRRDDLSPLSATTQGSRTSALGRLRFELTTHSRDWFTFTSYNKNDKNYRER